jgi:hypothetical protein
MDYYGAKPLCLVVNGDNYGAMKSTRGQVVKFLLDDNFKVVEIMGMYFYSWKPDFDKESQDNTGLVLLDAPNFTVLFSCVLLP